MSGYQAFIDEVNRYQDQYRNPALDRLNIGGLYDLFPHHGVCAESVAHCWADPWPNASSAGVYSMFDGNLSLLYVGKTSMNNCLGARLGAYFGFAADRTCLIKGADWKPTPRFVLTVGVPDDTKWEAPALEEFLIRRLNPPLNTLGRSE